MRYSVRVREVVAGVFATQEEAVAAVREIVLRDVDAEPEVLDDETGKPVTPGSSRGWREHLSQQIGY